MKKPLATTLCLVGLLAAGFAAPAAAAPGEDLRQGQTARQLENRNDSATVRFSRLLGRTIRNRQGEELGQIDDLIFAGPTGDIGYAVVTYADGLGMEGVRCLVPWNALNIEDQAVLLDMQAQRFRKAPKEKEITNGQLDEEALKFYGVAPNWQGSVGATSDLLEHEQETREERQ